MLVKKQEKNNKIKAMYSSATVCATVFDTDTKSLTVIFNNGGQYKYPDVSLTDYTRLEISESTGSEFNKHIKSKYKTFEKLETLSESALDTIKKDIATLVAEDTKLLLTTKTKIMLDSMHKVIGGYLTNNKIDYDMLRKTVAAIGEYDNVANPAPVNA